MTPDLRPLHEAPRSIRPPFDQRDDRTDYAAALHEAIGPNVELGAYDHRIIGWLANWDTSTVGSIASLLYRVRAAAPNGRPTHLEAAEELAAQARNLADAADAEGHETAYQEGYRDAHEEILEWLRSDFEPAAGESRGTDETTREA